jgi:WD40 repeat protein
MVALLAGMTLGCDKDDGSAPATRGAAAQGAGAQGAGAQPETPTIEPARFLEGHADGVHGVAFSPDSKRIATASHDGTARIWDVASAKELLRLEGHAGAVHSVAFSDDGTRVATAGADSMVMVWDAETGDLLSMLHGHERGVVMDVACLPNGVVVSVGQDQSLRRWDVDEERQIGAVRADARQVLCVATSPDGTRLATGGDTGFIVVWDADSGRPLWREKAPGSQDEEDQLRARQEREAAPPADAPAEGAGAARGGGAGEDGDAPAGAEPRPGRPAPVMRLAFSSDGSKLYSQSNWGFVTEWDAGTGRHLRHVEPHRPALTLDVSGDGRYLFLVVNDGPQIWDAAGMKRVANLVPQPLGQGERVHRAAVSPDGRTAVIGQGGGWDQGRWRRATETRVPIWDLSSLPK